MPTHYDLLGVDRDATKDEIRTAYLSRRDQLVGVEGDDARADLGRLNEAWQTLADPHQRQRYDSSLAGAGEPGDDVEVLDDGEEPAADQSRRRGRTQAAPETAKRNLPPSTVTVPAGTRFPETRTRINAMFFDVSVVLLVFLLVTQFIAPRIIKAMYPTENHQLQVVRDQRDAKTKDVDAAKKQLASAQQRLTEAKNKHQSTKTAQGAVTAAQSKVDALTKQRDALENKMVHLNQQMLPAYALALLIVLVLGLTYLVVPLMRHGRTYGMRRPRLRVVSLVGDGISARTALIRFGIPAVIVTAAQLLPPIALPVFVGVIVAMLTWIRNPNHQGWHDRAAKTIVVQEIDPTIATTARPASGGRA